MDLSIQALIMGLVQGLTEFIPVSSSGHLILVPWVMGWKDPFIDSLAFSVMLHMGTLLALILYYILYPTVQRLILAGISRGAAASLVTLAFLLLVAVCGSLALPWITLHLTDWQIAVERYLQGGISLLQRSLAGLEQRYGMLQRAHLAATVAQRMNDFTSGFAEHYVEPIALGIAAWTPSLLLAPFLSFFFLKDGRRFQTFLVGAVPNAFFEKTLYLMSEVDQ